jgi:hypothetical protein
MVSLTQCIQRKTSSISSPVLEGNMFSFICSSGNPKVLIKIKLVYETLHVQNFMSPSLSLPFLNPSSSFLLLYIPLHLLPSLSASKLQFVSLQLLILVFEGEVRVWLIRPDLGRMRFLSHGVWQGLSLGGGEKNSVLLHSTFKHW